MDTRPDTLETYDLPALAGRLAAGWPWLLGPALVAGLLALGLSALEPERYRAEALLAVARPASLSFDPRFAESEAAGRFPARVGSLRTYPELAGSDGIALGLAEARPELLEAGDVPEALRDRIAVESRAEGTLIAIEARADRPEAAAALANAWAEQVVAQAERLFGSGEDLAAVIEAREAAAEERRTAAEALSGFDLEQRLDRLEVEREVLTDDLSLRLGAMERLDRAQADIEGLMVQLEAGGQLGAALALAELRRGTLAALDAEAGPALALELPAESLDRAVTPREIDALRAQSEASRSLLADLVASKAEALARVQAEQTRLQAERTLLERELALADERHLTLARKADELRLAAAATRPELRLASPAAPSSALPWGDWARRALVAALAAALLGAGWLLWRPERQA